MGYQSDDFRDLWDDPCMAWKKCEGNGHTVPQGIYLQCNKDPSYRSHDGGKTWINLSPQEQLTRWVAGNSQCPNSDNECCPDFSCCVPKMKWPQAAREAFAAGGQRKREEMMCGVVDALIADPLVHVTGGSNEQAN